jgi:hypothetical protein
MCAATSDVGQFPNLSGRLGVTFKVNSFHPDAALVFFGWLLFVFGILVVQPSCGEARNVVRRQGPALIPQSELAYINRPRT